MFSARLMVLDLPTAGLDFAVDGPPRHYVSHWQLTEYGTGTEPPTHPASEYAHYGPRDIPPSGTPQKFSPLIALREKCCMSVRECNPEFTLSAPAGLKSSKPSMRTCPCVGPS